jgi:hypothetical protein
MKFGSRREIRFQDIRSPREVKLALERDMKTLFETKFENNKLFMRAKSTLVGAEYDFQVVFEAALPACNLYQLTMNVNWDDPTSKNFEYYCKTSNSWFELWTRELTPAEHPGPHEGSVQRYQLLCDDALNADQHLDSVAAVQAAIIAAMKQGTAFRTSHKEGGTHLAWNGNRFVRTDYGDNPSVQQFADETEFLNMLRQFYHWEVTSRFGGTQLSEIDMWRLILRRMDE